MATPPTDDQWAAMSKLLQSLIQRSDTGTYYSFMHAVRQLLPEINTPDVQTKRDTNAIWWLRFHIALLRVSARRPR